MKDELEGLYKGDTEKVEVSSTNDVQERVLASLNQRIVGQGEAKEQLADAIQQALSPLSMGEGPLGVMYFYGKTGTGKTEVTKALSEFMYGFDDGIVHIPCEQVQQSHHESKVFGSPPGYVGWNKPTPLSSENLYSSYNIAKENDTLNPLVKRFINSGIIVFDEIEKAHPSFHQSLLKILDEGIIELGSGKTVNARNCFIILTSNIGEKETATPDVGFNREDKGSEKKKAAIRKLFSPEFIGRVDSFVEFEALEREDKKTIMMLWEKEMIQDLGAISENVLVKVDPSVYEYILDTSNDETGIRSMKRRWNNEVRSPVGNAIFSNDLSDTKWNLVIRAVEEDMEVKFYINKDGIIKNVKKQLEDNLGKEEDHDKDGWSKDDDGDEEE